MPSQLIPLEGIDKSGFISDIPAVNLPPGAWSDVRNVRFNDGAIRKFSGHIPIFADVGLVRIQHIVYWENPNRRYYVIIDRSVAVINPDGTVETPAMDTVYTLQLESDGTSTLLPRGNFELPVGDERDVWQSVQFNGGFSIVINNSRSTPQHITAQTGIDLLNADVFEDLPGWDSYLDTNGGDQAGGNSVTANIVIAEGNVLLAGGLVERDSSGIVIRNLNSVVRVSDVAAPGTIPQNWNPFATTGTADEIVISDTGLITAIVPLRGSVYVYTSDTVTQLRITPQGLRSAVITKEYGALSQASVFEFKGQHLIIGSDDIYVFSGNPGDIQSIADGRVRKYFYDNLHASFIEDVQVIRDQAFDELWICFANLDSSDGSYNEALIWNYTDNVWTKRDLPNIQSLTTGPIPGAGSARTIITVPDGMTAFQSPATPATATFTINEVVPITFAVGAQDIQTATLNGTKNNDFTASSDQFFLRLPNNFQSGTNSTWEFDPDEDDLVYAAGSTIPTRNFSTGLDADAALAEMSTAMVTLTGTGVTPEVITTSLDVADGVVNVADVPANITFQLDNGDGPVGGFNASTFTGGTNAVTTGIDLVNNDGMLWIIPADTGGSGVAMATIFDTFNFEDGVSPNFLQTGTRNIPSGQGIDRFTTTGWEEDDFSGGSLNRTGDLNTQLSFAVTPDLFAMVDYTGGAGSPPVGVTSHELDSEFETGRTFDVVASGASGTSQVNAGRVTMMITGGGGGGLLGIASADGGGGSGGATAWATFDVQTGDIILVTIGTGGPLGVRNALDAQAGADSFIRLQRLGVTEEIIRAGGGGEGSPSGGALPAGTVTVGTPTLTTIIASGGGSGGLGGSGAFQGSTGLTGAGGGAGGYSGDGGRGANAAGNGPANLGSPGMGGGGAGGSTATNGNAAGGGGVGIYGEGPSGQPSPNTGSGGTGGGGGGSGGSTSTTGNGGAAGGGGGTGNGTHGAFRLLSGSTTITYPTTGVQNFQVHTEAHTLGSVPGAMLIKRTGIAPFGQSDWVFYHKDTFASGDVGFFNLDGRGPSNDNNNPSHFNGTHPTDSVFTIGNSVGSGSGNTNSASNSRYIAYLFASNEINGNSDPNGNIFCGTYDGNGSSSVRNFPLGWRPTRVIIKDVTNDNVVTMAFTNLNANGIELTQYAQVGRSAGQSIYREPTVHPAWEGSFEDTSFRLATNNNLWNRSNTRYVYIAMRESVPPVAPLSEFNDEPIFAATGSANNVITTGVDIRQSGFMFFGGVGTNENPYAPNTFETVNQTGSAAGSGQRARLPRLDNHEVTFGGNGAGDHFITSFQEDGFTLPADVFLNVPGDTWQVFSFADAPGFMSTTEFNSSALARVPDGMGGTMAPRFNIPHTLGQVPRMVLIKRLTRAEAGQNTNSLNPWNVWHQSTGNGLRLSTSFNATTNGISDSGWLQPEGTTHMSTRTTSTEVWTGGNADAYVMYAFGGKDVNGAPAPMTPAADDGTVAAGGRLIGGMSFDAFTVDLGWRPGFIMIKATADATGDSNNWRYWSKEDNFASVRHWNTTTRRNADTTLTVSDTGFSADLQNDASYIYWCSRDVVPNTAALPDFNLYDIEGTAVELNEAGRSAIAGGRGNEREFAAAVAAVDNHTATVSGNDVIITQDVWAGANNQTHEVANSNATFNSVVDNTANARTQANPSYRSGAVGYREMLVNLGTEQELNSEVTIVRGDGGVGTQLFTDVDETNDQGPPVGTSSFYTLTSPNGVSTVFTAGSGINTPEQTADSIVSHVNALMGADDPVYSATSTNNVVTLTADSRGAAVADWVIASTHTNTGASTDGDIAVVIETLAGNEGRDDAYGTATVTVTTPMVALGTFSTQTILGVADITPFDTAAADPGVVSVDISTDDIASALRNTTYTVYTTSGRGSDLTLTSTVAGRTESDFDISGVNATGAPGTPGTGSDIAAMLEIDITNLENADLGPISLNSEETGAEIRQRIIDHLAPFGQFSTAELGDTVVVTHNQFGVNRATVDVTYTPSMNISREGDSTIDPTDTIQSLGNVSEMSNEADPERPWDSGVLNEARAFVVTGGQENVFAMDLGGSFDGADIEAFIERRNFQLEPLLDTESLSGFYMHTDSATPTVAVPLFINLQGVDNSSTPLDLNLDMRSPQRYTFNIGGDNSDYKIDTRINARMLNFRISETGTTAWELQAMGVAIDKGGTR